MAMYENDQFGRYPQECLCRLYFAGHKSTMAPPLLRRTTTVWPFPYSPYYPRRTERPALYEPEFNRPEENQGSGVDAVGQSTGELQQRPHLIICILSQTANPDLKQLKEQFEIT
jgi:hypothetical protein